MLWSSSHVSHFRVRLLEARRFCRARYEWEAFRSPTGRHHVQHYKDDSTSSNDPKFYRTTKYQENCCKARFASVEAHDHDSAENVSLNKPRHRSPGSGMRSPALAVGRRCGGFSKTLRCVMMHLPSLSGLRAFKACFDQHFKNRNGPLRHLAPGYYCKRTVLMTNQLICSFLQ